MFHVFILIFIISIFYAWWELFKKLELIERAVKTGNYWLEILAKRKNQ